MKSVSSEGVDGAAASREQLSALVDGELESATVSAACAAWKDDPALRSTWHSYQLIGDVLRSDDLASDGERDRAFMASLRTRLAAEPVMLAPAAAVVAPRGETTRRGRWGWAAPSAIAAGFAAVAGVLLVTRAPSPEAQLAAAPWPSTALGVADAASLVSVPMPSVAFRDPLPASQTFIRDPHLDRYLEAHKQFAGSSAIGMASGYLRPTLAEVPGR